MAKSYDKCRICTKQMVCLIDPDECTEFEPSPRTTYKKEVTLGVKE